MKAAIIDQITKVVVNVVELAPDSDWLPPAGTVIEFSDEAIIGVKWNGTGFDLPDAGGDATPVLPAITKTQFFLQAAATNLITQDEALAAAQGGFIPSAFQAVFATLPQNQRFAAKVRLASMTTVDPGDDLILLAKSALNLSDQYIANFFTEASNL